MKAWDWKDLEEGSRQLEVALSARRHEVDAILEQEPAVVAWAAALPCPPAPPPSATLASNQTAAGRERWVAVAAGHRQQITQLERRRRWLQLCLRLARPYARCRILIWAVLGGWRRGEP